MLVRTTTTNVRLGARKC